MLDVGIADAAGQPADAGEPSFQFDDDGYYWFLHPLFEKLAAETGEYVDLYGDAFFAGPHLTALSRMLLEAKQVVDLQPESWEVHTGTQGNPNREIYKTVERAEFLGLLTTWERVAKQAKTIGRGVTCFGD